MRYLAGYATLVFWVIKLGITTATAQTSGAQGPDLPQYEILVMVQGKPANLYRGLPASTLIFGLEGYLTRQSQLEYPDLKPEVVINRVTISLLRKGQKLGSLIWTGNESLSALASQARAGDQYMLQFEEVTFETKAGALEKSQPTKYLAITLH